MKKLLSVAAVIAALALTACNYSGPVADDAYNGGATAPEKTGEATPGASDR